MTTTWFKRRKLSDVELIEQTRKFLPLSRKTKWLCLAGAVLSLCMVVAISVLASHWIKEAERLQNALDSISAERGRETSYALGYHHGLALGLFIGSVFGMFLTNGPLRDHVRSSLYPRT